MKTPYYCPSGRVPGAAYPISILISIGLIPLACLYAWLIVHVPFVFNFFVAFAFSMAIGWLTKQTAARGKVRSLSWIGRAGIVFGVAGWYLQWSAWVALTLCASSGMQNLASLGGTFMSLAAQPWQLIRSAIDIAANGTFNISGWPLKGAWLAAVWLIELWIHLMLPPLMGRMQAEEPFCESTGAWADKLVLPCKFALVDAVQVLPRLEADPLAIRTILAPSSVDESASHAEAVLYRTGGADAYLSITNVLIGVGKKGNVERKRDPVVEYLRLPDTNVDELIAHLATRKPVAERGIAPALTVALAHLEAERYTDALDSAATHVLSGDAELRADALRICALGCSRLARWGEAAHFFASLFDDEPTSHNALQVATSSVMAGALPAGLSWMERAGTLNAVSGEMPAMSLLTGFVTALRQAGQEAAAMPYVDQIRQAYTDLGSTDPTVLYLRSMPFFSVFLSNSLKFVRAGLSPEQGQAWYAAMMPSLDPAGREALAKWIEVEFGPAATGA